MTGVAKVELYSVGTENDDEYDAIMGLLGRPGKALDEFWLEILHK